jgi:GAF domain-containing protein
MVMAKKTSPVKTAVKKPLPALGGVPAAEDGDGSVMKKPAGKQKTRDKTPRLSTGLKRQAKIQKALYEIADAASAVTDMQSFYKRLHKIVGELMYAENFIIMLFDAITNTRSYPYYSDSAGDVAPPSSPIPAQSLLAELIRHPRTLHYNRQQNEDSIRRGEMFGTPAESFVGAPFKMGNQVIGGIIVQSYIKELTYSEEDVSVLEFVAQHIAVALTRARAIEETRQRNAELQVINSVQEGLASSLDIQSIYNLVGDKLRQIFDADTTFIVFHDNERNLLVASYYADKNLRRSFSRPYGTGVAEAIINSGKPLLLGTEEEHKQYGPHHVVSPGAEKDLNQSVLGAPIFIKGQAYGAVSVQSYKVHAFNENDLRLLQTLANSMSVALENARLFTETQRLLKETEDRAAELAIINSVQEGLASKLDIQGIYDLVGDKINEIFDTTTVVLATFDHEKGLMYWHYIIERGIRYSFEPMPIPPITAEFIRLGRTRLINNNLAGYMRQIDPNFELSLPRAGEIPKSLLSVPLRMQGELLGVIGLQNVDRENAFSDSDVRLLETLANSMSVALENARLFDETQQRNAELAIINSVQEGLASKLDMQAIYELVGENIRETFNAQVVSIATYDRAAQLLHGRYYFENGRVLPGITLSSFGFRKQVVENCKPIMINEDMPRWMEKYDNPVIQGSQPKSAIFIPMIVGDETTGVISLQNNDQENAFTEADLRLLTTLANSMSIALENARLWEQEKMYRKALEREFEIGREIQAGFLPDALPQPKGWEIAASLKSAREVAGDFYDVFELPDGKIGLVIADVCDKGLGAALFMTLFRSLIRAISNIDFFARVEDKSVNTSTARLKNAISLTNNYIAEIHGDTGMFATIFFGILDTNTGMLTYINGGHLPPLLVNAQGVKEILKISGPAVGAMTDADYVIREVMIEHGESFFAYTDGLTDTVNPAGEFFSEKDLIPFLIEDRPLSPLLTEFQKRVADHAAGVKQFDDITLLAARRL